MLRTAWEVLLEEVSALSRSENEFSGDEEVSYLIVLVLFYLDVRIAAKALDRHVKRPNQWRM